MQQSDASVTLSPQYVLRVVEARARKPLGPRHRSAAQHPRMGRGRLHTEVVPQCAPERLQVLNRPAPELHVIAERDPALPLQPPSERGYVGMLDPLGARCPENLTLSHRCSRPWKSTGRPTRRIGRPGTSLTPIYS